MSTFKIALFAIAATIVYYIVIVIMDLAKSKIILSETGKGNVILLKPEEEENSLQINKVERAGKKSKKDKDSDEPDLIPENTFGIIEISDEELVANDYDSTETEYDLDNYLTGKI